MFDGIILVINMKLAVFDNLCWHNSSLFIFLFASEVLMSSFVA